MDDLKALVDALVILNDDNLAQTVIDNNDVQWCLSELQDMLAADMEPVVRCRDCEHAERYERTDGTEGYYCEHPQNTFTYGERWDRAFKPVKEADDFCSYGERREE